MRKRNLFAPPLLVMATAAFAMQEPPQDRDVDAIGGGERGIRVALQAGHWKAHEAPHELRRIRDNGTRFGDLHEWQVTLRIARAAAELLEASGFTVEILPATIPPRYSADLFIALHADAFSSPSASGFSIAPPRRDATGRAASFAEMLAGTYAEGTNLRRRNMTRTMRGYYAFNSRRYRHALDPGTVAVILETGFLTSPSDRRIIVDDPDRSARAIAAAVERYFAEVESEDSSVPIRR